jgi:hypothetical protein
MPLSGRASIRTVRINIIVLSEVPFPAWNLRNGPKPRGNSPLEQGTWTRFSVAPKASRHLVAASQSAAVARAPNPVQ